MAVNTAMNPTFRAFVKNPGTVTKPETYSEKITSPTTLFPFTSDKYSVYAGTCEADNPHVVNSANAEPTAVSVSPGETAPATVALPPVNIEVMSGTEAGANKGTAVEGATGVITDTGCGTTRSFTETPGGALPHPGLPFGKYSICIESPGKKWVDTFTNNTTAGPSPENWTEDGTHCRQSRDHLHGHQPERRTHSYEPHELRDLPMSPLPTQPGHLRDEHGFTLIELLVSMIMMVVLTLAAFSFLQFTTEDVSHITARVGVDQTGRTALERIMLELHSACVTTSVIPIQEKSTENEVKFTSQSGKESAFATVYEHVIIYTAASGGKEGTLVEKTYPSTGAVKEGIYPFSTTASSTTKLLTGIKQTEYGGVKTPVFQYYRYYKEGDTIPVGDTTLPLANSIPRR